MYVNYLQTSVTLFLCGGSGMLIQDPDFFSSWIPYPTTPILEQVQKDFWSNWEPIDKKLNIQKNVINLSEILDGDPESGKKPISDPDPGIDKAPDPGSGSATLLFSKSLESERNRIQIKYSGRNGTSEG
jgi:hypothetical protein